MPKRTLSHRRWWNTLSDDEKWYDRRVHISQINSDYDTIKELKRYVKNLECRLKREKDNG